MPLQAFTPLFTGLGSDWELALGILNRENKETRKSLALKKDKGCKYDLVLLFLSEYWIQKVWTSIIAITVADGSALSLSKWYVELPK